MAEFYRFPKGFQWGTATAAYQVEGAAHEGGRSDSVWDVFAHTPGIIKDDDNGDVACDHYHRWKDDINIMKNLDYKAYRFSIAWPRILPEGSGKINQRGVDFYNRLIDELIKAGVTPMITLYHWDIPVAIQDGWLNRASTDAFEELAGIAAHAYGDRVKHWCTINEPYCASIMSYGAGIHAPGLSDPYKGLVAAHHLLLAHGKAVPVIRANCANAQVGIALNLSSAYPYSNSASDQYVTKIAEGQSNRWFIDPIFGRSYPLDIIQNFVKTGVIQDATLDFVEDGDLKVIAAPLDYLGLNYYTRQVFQAVESKDSGEIICRGVPAPEDNQTDIGWEIYPKGFYDLLVKVNNEYKPSKIIITENGASYATGPDLDGKVNDEKRIAYLDIHLQTLGRAIQAGVPVVGYYLWSFLDNFEWRHGYSQRFGLVHVDYKTQKRTIKNSAYWYSKVIKDNGLIIE